MQNDKIVVGLDIGTTKIVVIVGHKNDYGKLDVLGMGKAVSDGVVKGKVINIEKTILAIKKAVEEAEDNSGIDIKVVNVGIAGHHIRSSIQRGSITREDRDEEITVEDVNRLTNDMHRMVIPAGNQIIHVMPQVYTVDYDDGIKDPVGMTGIRLEADFHVITADINSINNIQKCVKRAGLDIENMILEPLASSLAVLSDDEKEAGVCLVDIGGGTTDIAIFHENIIRHTGVIPFGGNIITSDIKEGCMVMQQQAELLKTKFGRAISTEASENEIVSIPGLRNRAPKEISIKNLAHIVEARMEEIIDLVHAEILASGYEGRLAGGIVITGGGSQMHSARQLVEYLTGMDARIGYPNEHLGRTKIEAVKSPMYATSVGLVLAGYRSIDERENRYLEAKLNNQNMFINHKQKSAKREGDFFSKIINKTKSFLIDDFDDKDDY
ncbi:cell division protein FtsA [Marivirga harenae]|uniref:cell division protein FtsA n=1 Tax=Marivirga harenae TaxID=2010992 RepID=UPI0026E07188|nr:cell division protein FtsA [Marivirga harenae]WKV14079.1 cell division protein FtsA [Marivirga harenae]|tara:strand:+ start:373935 stop:375251 length:1317 start_codon:yes stop_codon:yes gene_type:complete